MPAQSPLPPGIFGYDADYGIRIARSISSARAAAARRGRLPGRDRPEDGPAAAPHLRHRRHLDARALRFQFFVNAWSRLGLDVEIAATNYNQFQEKVRNGAYQIFMWGWVADYPDPENFLFLLWGPHGAQSKSDGPNTANFANPRYDELFLRR